MALTSSADLPHDGTAPPAATPGEDRLALGVALQARSRRIAAEVAAPFPARIRDEVSESARLATELVGRWLATGEKGVGEERRIHHRRTQKAMLVEADLATAVRGYLSWRDLCSSALVEEADRLGIGESAVNVARMFVQLNCDGGVVRTVRAFDESWQLLQERLRAQQDDLSHQVLHDDLTGLPNRLLLTDRLRQAASRGDRRGTGSMLLFLDLDSFKAINDRFGHPAGDALLVEVAGRLLELVRATDTVARLGGDEFVVLAEDLEDPDEAARSLAERIHRTMCTPVSVGERELHTSVSIGIADVGRGIEPDVCLAQADAAMYRAKRDGPARFAVYDAQIGAEHQREAHLADELRMAHGRGELTLDYQPLFRLSDGVPSGIVGMEALLRWNHSELGQVAPTEFVPLLEQSRQIVPVGRWVLEEAAYQCVAWQRRGWPDLSVSVNVSARQLHDPGLYDDVREALERSGLAPGQLVLEVSESVLVLDVVRIGAAMQELRDLGVHLALDDFGTGHSSLHYLQGLPIDRLKVDRRSVAELDGAGTTGTVMHTVVDLAHRLGIAVVAEGVETPAELRAVCAIGCDEAQGNLLSGPAAAHLLDVWLVDGAGPPGSPPRRPVSG
jgi:diguanylate cyclase (GGDEF)-like protein